MNARILPLMFKALVRNKLRLLVTTGCCVIAGLIISFSLVAESSLARVAEGATGSMNLVLTQKDRY